MAPGTKQVNFWLPAELIDTVKKMSLLSGYKSQREVWEEVIRIGLSSSLGDASKDTEVARLARVNARFGAETIFLLHELIHLLDPEEGSTHIAKARKRAAKVREELGL